MTVKSIWRALTSGGQIRNERQRGRQPRASKREKEEKPSIAFVIQREAARPSEESGALAGDALDLCGSGVAGLGEQQEIPRAARNDS